MASGSHHSSGSHSGSHHSSSHSSSHSSHSHSSGGYHSSHSSYHSRSASGLTHGALPLFNIPEKGILYDKDEVTIDPASLAHVNGQGQSVSSSATLASPLVNSENLIIHYALGDRQENVQTADSTLSHGSSWIKGNSYCLHTKDTYFLTHYPKPESANPERKLITFSIISFFLFLCAVSNFIYELLILPFERISMTDGAFQTLDNLIYYGQFFLPFIVFGIGYFFVQKKHRQNAMFVREMLKHYQVEDERIHYERTHEFYTICPQCGAPRQQDNSICLYCGASLLKQIESN